MPSTQIAILAGGQSRRMGTDKAFVLLDGKPLLQHVIDRVSVLDLPVIMIANDIKKYSVFGLPVFPDVIPNMGSIGGIYTALQQGDAERTLCVACDMPFLNPGLLRYLIDQSPDQDVVVPLVEEMAHSLHTVYSRACLPVIHAQILKKELAIRHVFPQVCALFIPEEQLRQYDENLQSLVNMNTPVDLERHASQD